MSKLPIYEYKCRNCGKAFEILQKFSDPPLSECSACSGEVTKLISQSTFHLKGTGWYATDYGRNSGSWDQEGEKPDSKKDDGQNDKKIDAKSAGDSTTSDSGD